jgi:hypothetical protein
MRWDLGIALSLTLYLLIIVERHPAPSPLIVCVLHKSKMMITLCQWTRSICVCVWVSLFERHYRRGVQGGSEAQHGRVAARNIQWWKKMMPMNNEIGGRRRILQNCSISFIHRKPPALRASEQYLNFITIRIMPPCGARFNSFLNTIKRFWANFGKSPLAVCVVCLVGIRNPPYLLLLSITHYIDDQFFASQRREGVVDVDLVYRGTEWQ